MKLKLDDAGHAVINDGKPVYIADDGREVAFDVAGTVTTISRLNSEAKGHRERAEAAEGKLKAFDGITDPGEALKALNTVRNLDAKKLVDAGEVEKIRDEAIKAVEGKFLPVVQERDQLRGQLFAEKVGGAFTRSKLIAEKFAIPADLVQARFGQHFTVEEGRIVAKDAAGNKLFSRSNPGALADFDEALETLVDAYPYRDQILKASSASGGGSQGNGNGNGNSGQRTISRAAFNALSPHEQAKAAREAKLVD